METVEMTASQKKSRRSRNIALGFVLGFLGIGFYVLTLIKIGQGMAP